MRPHFDTGLEAFEAERQHFYLGLEGHEAKRHAQEARMMYYNNKITQSDGFAKAQKCIK